MSGNEHNEPATPEELYGLLRRVRPLHRALVRIVEGHLTDTGLTRPMRAVLEQLDENGPQAVPQLARALSVRRQFVQRVVNDLIAAGLVERRPNVAHRRSWLIAPTAAGERAFAEVRAREWEHLRQVAGSLEGARIRDATATLERLAREAERAAREHGQQSGFDERGSAAAD